MFEKGGGYGLLTILLQMIFFILNIMKMNILHVIFYYFQSYSFNIHYAFQYNFALIFCYEVHRPYRRRLTHERKINSPPKGHKCRICEVAIIPAGWASPASCRSLKRAPGRATSARCPTPQSPSTSTAGCTRGPSAAPRSWCRTSPPTATSST